MRSRGAATCQVRGVGPEERVFVHTGLTDHLLQFHTVWNNTAQVLETQTGEVSDGWPAEGATAASLLQSPNQLMEHILHQLQTQRKPLQPWSQDCDITAVTSQLPGELLFDSPCRAASPHTPHTESSHPQPGRKTSRDTYLMKGPQHTWWTGQVTRVSHLVIWVWVRPAAGTIKSKEVVTVFVQTVDLILLLQHTHT